MLRHLALLGPTASGKSELALRVAAADARCELVSLDSMQVYRGLDIGTAKPTAAERAAVPHHLVDVVDADGDWSVRRAQLEARAIVADLEARGRRAVFVGGTGLYVQAVLGALDIPPHDPEVRAVLDAEADTDGGLERLWTELVGVDPAAAANIEPGNRRRIVRALEVVRATGRPFSSSGEGVFAGATAFPVRMVGLWWTRGALVARIDTRIAQMRRAGLVAEVDAVADRLSPTAAQAIGYKELLAHRTPDRPLAAMRPEELDAAFSLVAARTRQFARRQRMWFRRDPRIVWFAAGGNVDDLTRCVLACWNTP